MASAARMGQRNQDSRRAGLCGRRFFFNQKNNGGSAIIRHGDEKLHNNQASVKKTTGRVGRSPSTGL
jgi:hypothetical protein